MGNFITEEDIRLHIDDFKTNGYVSWFDYDSNEKTRLDGYEMGVINQSNFPGLGLELIIRFKEYRQISDIIDDNQGISFLDFKSECAFLVFRPKNRKSDHIYVWDGLVFECSKYLLIVRIMNRFEWKNLNKIEILDELDNLKPFNSNKYRLIENSHSKRVFYLDDRICFNVPFYAFDELLIKKSYNINEFNYKINDGLIIVEVLTDENESNNKTRFVFDAEDLRLISKKNF